MVYVIPCSWPCNISTILVSWYKGGNFHKTTTGWHEIGAQPPLPPKSSSKPTNVCDVFQSADCGWGWRDDFDWKSRWKSVLTLVCCTHVVLVNYQGLQSETLFRPWGIYVFPYGLICFFYVYSFASQELLLPYCDIKSGAIEKDGSTVPRMQGMRSSAEGFQEVIEVHVIHQILWLKLTYCSRWWFQIFFIFTPIWGRFPIWWIFFRRVETTN